MRIVSIVGIVVLMLAMTASAQSQIKFGVKAGAAMATMSGDGWDDIEVLDSVSIEKKYKLGLAAGAFVEFPLGTSGVSLQPEFLYVIKGAKAEVTEEGETYTEKLKNDYLEVPVLIKYNFTTAGSTSPFMFVGPVAAFNIGSEMMVEDPPAADSTLGDFDIDNAKSLDFGLTIGGGLGLAMGQSGKLTFDLRYTIGLGDVFEDADDSVDDSGKINFVDEAGNALDFKNSDIRLMVGFQF